MTEHTDATERVIAATLALHEAVGPVLDNLIQRVEALEMRLTQYEAAAAMTKGTMGDIEND
jgi:hypothetical protein